MMSEFVSMIDPVLRSTGWMLIHSLWQGLVIGGIAFLLIRFATARSEHSYKVLVGALSLFLIVCAATFAYYITNDSSSVHQPIQIATESQENVVIVATTGAEESGEQFAFITGFLNTHITSIVYIWLAGLFFFGLRFFSGLFELRKIKASAQYVSHNVMARANEIVDKMMIKKGVSIFQSAIVKSPMVIGHLKPMVIFPLGMLSGIPAGHLEAILAHEMAHIKRYDYLVNIMQSVVEVLFFYHPVVWWMSNKIRDEREHCCDDIAVAYCNNPKEYVRALADVESYAVTNSLLTTAFPGKKMKLFERAKRIVTPKNKVISTFDKVFAIILAVILFGVTSVALEASARVYQPDEVSAFFDPNFITWKAQINAEKNATINARLNATENAKTYAKVNALANESANPDSILEVEVMINKEEHKSLRDQSRVFIINRRKDSSFVWYGDSVHKDIHVVADSMIFISAETGDSNIVKIYSSNKKKPQVITIQSSVDTVDIDYDMNVIVTDTNEGKYVIHGSTLDSIDWQEVTYDITGVMHGDSSGQDFEWVTGDDSIMVTVFQKDNHDITTIMKSPKYKMISDSTLNKYFISVTSDSAKNHLSYTFAEGDSLTELYFKTATGVDSLLKYKYLNPDSDSLFVWVSLKKELADQKEELEEIEIELKKMKAELTENSDSLAEQELKLLKQLEKLEKQRVLLEEKVKVSSDVIILDRSGKNKKYEHNDHFDELIYAIRDYVLDNDLVSSNKVEFSKSDGKITINGKEITGGHKEEIMDIIKNHPNAFDVDMEKDTYSFSFILLLED